jgi:hypothetical protein
MLPVVRWMHCKKKFTIYEVLACFYLTMMILSWLIAITKRIAHLPDTSER